MGRLCGAPPQTHRSKQHPYQKHAQLSTPLTPKVLEVLWDDSVALCLTPQAFSNIDPRGDIFNNINQQFWE